MELVGFGIFLFAGATWIGVFGAAMKNEKVLRLINAKFGTLFFLFCLFFGQLFGAYWLFFSASSLHRFDHLRGKKELSGTEMNHGVRRMGQLLTGKKLVLHS